MRFKKILPILVILVLSGVATFLITRGDAHKNSFDKPIEGPRPETDYSPNNSSTSSDARKVVWLTDYRQALNRAEEENKHVVVDFFATWCGPCKIMDQTTFVEDRVRSRLADFVPLKIDVDQQRDIAARYEIQGLPTIMVLDSNGTPIAGAVGYLNADRFLELLSKNESGGKAQSDSGILGEEAPGLGVNTWFNLPEGRTSVDISDYNGKVVYLYGFQSWCPGCHKYGFPTLIELIDHYQSNQDVAFVAVQTTFEGFNTNTPQSAMQTADRYGLTIPVGHSGSESERSTVMQRYRTRGTPWTVIIDREGVVRYNDFHIASNDAISLIDNLLVGK